MDQTIASNQTVQSVPVVSVQPPTQIPSVQKYAGFWRRYFAYTIDMMIIGIVNASMGFSFAFTLKGGQFYAFIPSLIISAGYFVFFWSKQNGQTLGNQLLAIKVVKEDGSTVDPLTGIVRYFGYLLSSAIFSLGFLWSIWDSKKQGWHDKIAKTVVYETGENPKKGVVIIIFVGAVLSMLALIGVLFAVVLVAVNPAKQMAQARDAQRRADLNSITTALNAYSIDNSGKFPPEITTSPKQIGSNDLDLRDELVPEFMQKIPYDPTIGSESKTSYYLSIDTRGRLVATAKSEVNPGTDITVSR